MSSVSFLGGIFTEEALKEIRDFEHNLVWNSAQKGIKQSTGNSSTGNRFFDNSPICM